ncbi:hypothetical protein RclHR1_07490010 [Rhizophagus clarus]|uniref:Uncharacterized protein n=1 Tax=Rhizophagus clarus TaxID=94130 RepID=A0A2Z6S8W1_9GLOM|nr:hypothetical protein RclHR1_07490010 [Rhizophagus clarus]GES80593.1 hypothetical protein GLOIN_2v1883854 [Rhizophagus clarus]
MDETEFHRSLQETTNLYSVWRRGEANRATPLSANSNSNCLGCSSPTLDDLHNEYGVYQENGASRPERISFRNANYLERKNYDDGNECVGSPNSSKCNSVRGKREDQIYVRGISSEQSRNNVDNKDDGVREQSQNSRFESTSFSDIRMVSFECCPNRSSQLPLGKLRRAGILSGNAWTKEEPKTPCRLVVPNFKSGQERVPRTMFHVPSSEKQDESREGCDIPTNRLMVVDMIANKKDRKRAANYLNCDLEGGDPSTCICYMKFIKQYGFDHIIIIGERYAGLLFLDCYGRVFEWDNSMCGILWPLGDYLNEAPKVSLTHRVMWSFESDGTVVEWEFAEDDSLDKPTSDIPATVAKKKKKKNSKKKHSKKK